MADYAQPGAVARRVRFFDGQFLVDQDFIDEQQYHLDRERRLGKVLHITGIVEGLAVSSGEPNTVSVSAGTAIDGDGRQLVLVQDRKVDLPAATFNETQEIRLQIIYREQATEPATHTGSTGDRRWLEDPQVIAVTTDGQSTEKVWNDTMPPVMMAHLRLDNRGTVTVDGSVAQYAGLRLPGTLGIGTAKPGAYKLSVNGRTRLGGDADYRGDAVLSIAPGTVQFDAPTQPGGRLVVDGTTGDVGIGTPSPDGYRLNVNGRTRIGGADYHAATVFSVAPGTIQFDAPNVPGGRLVVEGTTGYVGIGLGTATPRSPLDTGKGVMSGAANDYMKAQFTMSGGGTVTWGGIGQRLKWTRRFIVISAERGQTFALGYVNINQPTTPIPEANVYDGAARTADDDGVVLKDWDALYAVLTVGGGVDAVSSFQIRRYTNVFNAPSNWILVAVVNGDDGSVKLGTGVTLSARSSSSRGSPLPTGTILMWSGAVTAIPDGWALCNGANTTPDLRSRFIVGAGTGGSPEYAPDEYADPDPHNHRIATPTTRLTTSDSGDHSHSPPSSWEDRDLVGGGTAALKYYNGIDRGSRSVKSVYTSTDGSHTHAFTVNIDAFNSATSSGTRPKWYALCFIMKV